VRLHRLDQLLAGACEIAISGYRLDLVGDIVALQEGGQDSTSAEGIGFECYEDQHGRRERMI
jgi:hypothetical protein